MILMRPYTSKDSTKLSQAINQVCADTPWMSTRSFIPTDSWVHAMDMEDCHYHRLLVADSNGEIVGWCRSFPAACGVLPSHAELGIGLLAQHRNQGIGTELIMRSLEWAEDAGLRKVDLTVSLRNSIAFHVFEKCGFEPASAQGNKMLMTICLS